MPGYKLNSLLVFTLITTFLCITNGESDCKPPTGGDGTCKLTQDCPPILERLHKKDQTKEDFDILGKSDCDIGSELGACCPDSCVTPEGKRGSCVNIHYCPSLGRLLQKPVSPQAKEYVRNSRCKSTEKYIVCCPLQNPDMEIPGNCSAKLTEFPPEPSSECCGVDNVVGNKIVGGNATSIDQYPWLVLIQYTEKVISKSQTPKTYLSCGGSLISSRFVLTAAHCVLGDILSYSKPTAVRLGEYDIANDGPDMAAVGGGTDVTDDIVIIPIERTIPHAEFSLAKAHSPHDIALLKLAEDAPYTEFIRPICLPAADVTLSPPDNLVLFAAGWGATSNETYYSAVKQHVELPLVSNDICEPKYELNGRKLKLITGQMCAGGVLGKDSCRGDSGGPLMRENGKYYEVIGVVSFGRGCGETPTPGVYTKVFEYLQWIRKTINTA